MNRREVIEITAPSHWASYLINGDDSGLDQEDKAACDSWIEAEGLGLPVSCEEHGFLWRHGASRFALAADCQVYSFLREVTQ
jgi:hypothetical protein